MQTNTEYKNKLLQVKNIIENGGYNLAQIEHIIKGLELFGIEYVDFWLNFVKTNKSTVGFEKTEQIVRNMKKLPKTVVVEQMDVINGLYHNNRLNDATNQFDNLFLKEVSFKK